jgi:hypothetical protein
MKRQPKMMPAPPCWCDNGPPKPKLLRSLPCQSCGELSPVGEVANLAIHDCEGEEWQFITFTADMPCPMHDLAGWPR